MYLFSQINDNVIELQYELGELAPHNPSSSNDSEEEK